MANEPWRKALEDLDTDVLGAQTIALGTPWASIACVCALLDAGLIDRTRMLDIVDTLISIVTTLTADEMGEPEDVTSSLTVLRDFLEIADLESGRAVEALRAWDEGSMRSHLERLMLRRPRGSA